MITKKILPYEALFRWENGQFKAAHIQYIQVVEDDGKILSQTPLDPQPVKEGTEFPLEDVLVKIQVDSLSANTVLKEENEDVKTKIEFATKEKEEAQKKLQDFKDQLKVLSES